MKRKILLALFSFALVSSASAQKKNDKPTAYAITGSEKGNRVWTEVKLVDLTTGEMINPVYESKSEVKRLNARTKKPIVISAPVEPEISIIGPGGQRTTARTAKTDAGDIVIISTERTPSTNSNDNVTQTYTRTERRVMVRSGHYKKEDPFATSSAACAFDKKNNRLYYTPMGINQLRYIDLKEKSSTIYYFEDEKFGNVKGMGDVHNQITRMVIASDGNGYALTNKADQLIRFTTKKKPVITELGPVTDDASNGKFSVSDHHAYGGDMVADDAGNLYLITANRRVYKINIETRVAKYLGSIKGLPEKYTTNGAIVENENSIIVTSSTSTKGYYRFALENMQAELVSNGGPVFNASDLANGNLLSGKKKKDEQPIAQEEVLAQEQGLKPAVEKSIRTDIARPHVLAIYPNPVTNYQTKLVLTDYPEGRYELQVMDLMGRQIAKQTLTIYSKSQTVDCRIPAQSAKGTYLVRVMNSANAEMNVERLIVQ
jgi:hypothetical protein